MDTNSASRGQVSGDAAEVYEQFFVPALFGQWAGHTLDAAGITETSGPGSRVLDVGCGTGVVARKAARRVGPTGRVRGLDPNAGMLAEARGQHLTWAGTPVRRRRCPSTTPASTRWPASSC